MAKFKKLELFLFDNNIRYNYNVKLSNYTTSHLGGKAKYIAHVESSEAIIALVDFCKKSKITYFLLGNGSKILFSDRLFKGVIISFKRFNQINVKGNNLVIQSGALLPLICQVAYENSLGGIEALHQIPGTIGGALVNNAGANGTQISDVIVNATVYDGNSLKVLNKEELGLSYRFSTIFSSELVLIYIELALTPQKKTKIKRAMNDASYKRKLAQPMLANTFGSTFKNPDSLSAWKLVKTIEDKMRANDINISKKHANFLEFASNISAQKLANYIVKIQKKVYNEHGVFLNPEVIMINFSRRFYKKASKLESRCKKML